MLQFFMFMIFVQTWENPFHVDIWTGLPGDQDPIDVCEVGSKPVATGTVLPVKVETSWGWTMPGSGQARASSAQAVAEWPNQKKKRFIHVTSAIQWSRAAYAPCLDHFGILHLCLQVLGILALIEGGEEQTDWKVIVMNSEEAEEKMINTLDDLNNEYPDLLETIQKFLRVYKTPTGEPENNFAFNGEVQDKALALEVIR